MKLLRLKVARSSSLLFISFLFCFSAFSQFYDTHPSHPGHERCSTVEMDSIRHAENPDLQTNEEFEEWLEKLISEKKKRQAQGLIINGVYQIPIVVHVLHDGEAIGTGRNLSVATVQSQIDVMNEDFRRIFGSNGYNTDPDGADTEIEFCLARRRPDGSAFPAGEDGINRVDAGAQFGGGPTYATATIDGTIKPWFTATQFGGWDPADYMNFWSIDLQGGLLGYAQFPTTVLGGMGCNAQNVTTDGVVMDYQTIGKGAVTGFPGPFNEGRTATHEVGHWLGLRHIWGDGGCGVDDFCLDTPESDAPNGGCPTGHVSCGTVDMIENYMDYTNDLCMNIFTNDQKMRMRTVLENSPIRASLITSDACIPPALSDASITGIIDPDGDNCAGPVTPTVILRNRGASNLTTATINYTINSVPAGTFNWTGNIAPGAENNVVLPAFTAPLGVHEFKAFSELPNGVIDPDPTYDTTSIFFAVSNGIQPDYAQDFEIGVFPPDVRWSADNPNGDCYEWVGQACVSSTGASNNVAAQMTNFNNGTNQDEYLYTPYFILPCNATAANVTFDKAYRRRIAGSNDRLRLEMSDDCGATWSTVLFDESGGTLDGPNGTATGYWIPTLASEWQNVNVDLLPYVSGTSQSVQFRFRATNDGNGGNLYVDNFNYTAVTPGEIEVQVAGVDVLDGGVYDFGAGPVGGTVTATFTISNPGTSPLILTGPITVAGNPEFVLNSTFGTTTVPAGGSTTFSIDFTASGAGPFAGTVTFGSNDCDEGVYDFLLSGTGDVQPPTAGFSASPTAICEGQSVTYTSSSSGATTYAWSFPGGTPNSATGVGPHIVTYAAAGTYSASLTVTNPYGTDTDNQTNIISVASGTGTALPIAEGFDGGSFAPAGWSVGNGGNQAITWTQDPNNNGTAPTAGNSARIDFFSTNTAGDQDSLFVLPADLTGLSSAQMTFDKAYARYNGTFNDRMQVVVSTDCGNSWAIVFDQASAVLATDPDQTGAYTAPATWVNETVDLTPYIGQSNVQIAFVGISGYGQYLYVDNVNLTGVAGCTDPDVPTVTAAAGPYCEGDVVALNIAGNLNDATQWSIYSGSCGGTLLGTTATGTFNVTLAAGSNDYFVRGEGGCVVPGACGTTSISAGAIPAAPTVTVVDNCGSSTLTATGTNLLWSTGETTASIT
ncbi:choice-of-anchor J domain-containing protein, partial [Crocinitomicaceae bacterium]|nr:choice-of-anchor J domain-containing protein [Crocinitomicaceae bacterium]